MPTKLYVGGIPFAVTDDELKAHFEQAGAVSSANVIMDKYSGRSRGFGFVEMAGDEDGDKAIEMFNNSDMGGRNIIVNEARPMRERSDEGPRE